MGYQGKQKTGNAWSCLQPDQVGCQRSVLHGAAKGTSWWLLSHGRHYLGDADQRVALRSGMGWESSGSILGTGSGTWLQSPTRLRRGETLFPLRGTVRAAAGAGNHPTAAGVCALMCPSRRLHSEAFFALKQWITVPAASGRRCREKPHGKKRGESPLSIAKTPGSSQPVVLASPMFHGHAEDL